MAGLQPQVRRAVLAVVLGFTAAAPSAGLAAALDPRLFGAWASSAADCQKLFVRSGGALTYRRPVDQFAQAVIIEPGQIRSPTGVCRIVSAARDKNGVAVSLDCQDFDQLPLRNCPLQDPQRRRDRLQSDGRRVARHDLSKMPAVTPAVSRSIADGGASLRPYSPVGLRDIGLIGRVADCASWLDGLSAHRRKCCTIEKPQDRQAGACAEPERQPSEQGREACPRPIGAPASTAVHSSQRERRSPPPNSPVPSSSGPVPPTRSRSASTIR